MKEIWGCTNDLRGEFFILAKYSIFHFFYCLNLFVIFCWLPSLHIITFKHKNIHVENREQKSGNFLINNFVNQNQNLLKINLKDISGLFFLLECEFFYLFEIWNNICSYNLQVLKMGYILVTYLFFQSNRFFIFKN